MSYNTLGTTIRPGHVLLASTHCDTHKAELEWGDLTPAPADVECQPILCGVKLHDA